MNIRSDRLPTLPELQAALRSAADRLVSSGSCDWDKLKEFRILACKVRGDEATTRPYQSLEEIVPARHYAELLGSVGLLQFASHVDVAWTWRPALRRVDSARRVRWSRHLLADSQTSCLLDDLEARAILLAKKSGRPVSVELAVSAVEGLLAVVGCIRWTQACAGHATEVHYLEPPSGGGTSARVLTRRCL